MSHQVLGSCRPKYGSQHEESGYGDDSSEATALAVGDRNPKGLATPQSCIQKFHEHATSNDDPDCKLSSCSDTDPITDRAVGSKIQLPNESIDAKVVAPPNSPTISHSSAATVHHCNTMASLRKAARSLDGISAKEQPKEAKKTSSGLFQRDCTIARQSESTNELQEKTLPSAIPKQTKKVFDPSLVIEESSGGLRRSARLDAHRGSCLDVQRSHLNVSDAKERREEDPRVLAILELQDGVMLRVFSGDDSREGPVSNVAKGSDIGKTQNTKKPFPVLVRNMINEEDHGGRSIMRWEHGGAAFSVDSSHPDLPSLLAGYFQSQQFSSFCRQLYAYGWRKSKYSHKGTSKYNGMFWNRLFHRDKSDEELSKIYRGFRSSPPVLTRPSPTPPQKARRVSARLNTISQECHDRSSQKKLPTTPSPNASVGVGGAIADMLPCLSNTPIPVKEIAVEAKEDIPPIKLHSFEKERFDTQLDSPMNGVGMLTPSGERILSKDPMMILHSTESTPSATQWEKFSHLNCFTTKRELDDISDLSTEAPIRASEIFRTPSTYLCDLSVFPLGSLGLHTIQPSSSKRDWASSAAKGFQEGFTPIVHALDQAFKAADPQFNTTSTPDQEPPTKKVFSSKASDETSSSTNSILHGSCTQFSPLVPKFNHSGWAVLLPEVHSRAKQHSPAPWTGDDPTAISRFSGPSRHQNLRHPPAHLH